MESRILIKNIGKPKGGQTETFAAAQHAELTIGRDPSCDIKFDPNDDLVSRRHSKITKVSDVPEYTIADLGSRNGTLVNKRRIFEPTKLNCGDIVQLGPDGPQFEFDLDPRPASMIKPTRLSDATLGPEVGGMAPTRQTATPMLTTREAPPATAAAGGGGVGKATVERMIGETKRKSQTTAIAAVVVILLIVGGLTTWLYLTRPRQIDQKKLAEELEKKIPSNFSPEKIATANTAATVYIEAGWKLIDTASGKQLYHVLLPNAQKNPQKPDTLIEIIPDAGKFIPAFAIEDGKLEPILTTDEKNSEGANNIPIGVRLTGSGFVVSNDGFILTNRHVAANWFTRYNFPVPYGIVVEFEGGRVSRLTPISSNQFPAWVPEQAKLVTSWNSARPALSSAKAIEGRNDYLDVTFAKDSNRKPARVVGISDRADVAMIKIDSVGSLTKCELNDNYDSIQVGAAVVTLGYPAVSDAVVSIIKSQDMFNRATQYKIVPDPTLSAGYIGRIERSTATVSQISGGDFYQLTINSTGGGNSGGPVFDDHGRVVAIFDLSQKMDAMITGAVPIRYGMELMGVKPTVETR